MVSFFPKRAEPTTSFGTVALAESTKEVLQAPTLSIQISLDKYAGISDIQNRRKRDVS